MIDALLALLVWSILLCSAFGCIASFSIAVYLWLRRARHTSED